MELSCEFLGFEGRVAEMKAQTQLEVGSVIEDLQL